MQGRLNAAGRRFSDSKLQFPTAALSALSQALQGAQLIAREPATVVFVGLGEVSYCNGEQVIVIHVAVFLRGSAYDESCKCWKMRERE